MTPPTGLSPASAAFLLGLLNQQQLSVGAPDFEEAAASVIQARAELQAIIASESNTA